jgi:hypothetical protein
MSRALFWISDLDGPGYFEVHDSTSIQFLQERDYLEVTGDLEDEAAFQREQTGETDEDE